MTTRLLFSFSDISFIVPRKYHPFTPFKFCSLYALGYNAFFFFFDKMEPTRPEEILIKYFSSFFWAISSDYGFELAILLANIYKINWYAYLKTENSMLSSNPLEKKKKKSHPKKLKAENFCTV